MDTFLECLHLLEGPKQASSEQEPRVRVWLIIAHPDDEAMFFTPTLVKLKELGIRVKVICLSSGNAQGLGKVREKELFESCKTYQIPPHDVFVIDHPELQDGMEEEWSPEVIADTLYTYVLEDTASILISFDEKGVSLHPNHCAIAHGLRSGTTSFRIDSHKLNSGATQKVA